MGRISRALDKLRTKCTEEGTHPKGKSIASILECIAEHYKSGGGGGGTAYVEETTEKRTMDGVEVPTLDYMQARHIVTKYDEGTECRIKYNATLYGFTYPVVDAAYEDGIFVVKADSGKGIVVYMGNGERVNAKIDYNYDKKQNKLIAGENINIDQNNVISATGGGGGSDRVVVETTEAEDFMPKLTVEQGHQIIQGIIDKKDCAIKLTINDRGETIQLLYKVVQGMAFDSTNGGFAVFNEDMKKIIGYEVETENVFSTKEPIKPTAEEIRRELGYHEQEVEIGGETMTILVKNN